ncbi:hypothetical protein ACOMHN_023408 [Nucella lapillus]
MTEAKKAKGTYDDSAFQTMEKEFQETLKELLGDQALGKFRAEYEKLFTALSKSHDNERRLMNRCRDLNTEIVANAGKVAASLKLSEDDTETIATLRQEIQRTWKLVDLAHEKETRSRETIGSLKEEIHNLSSLVEKGVGCLPGQETSLNELLKTKEELTRERDGHLQEISHLREQLCGATDKVTAMEQHKTELDSKVFGVATDKVTAVEKQKRELVDNVLGVGILMTFSWVHLTLSFPLCGVGGGGEQRFEATDKMSAMEQQKTDLDDKVLELTKDVQDLNCQMQRESRKKDRLERELRQAHVDLGARAGDIQDLSTQLEEIRTDLFIQERLTKEQRMISERTLKDAEMLGQRCDKMRQELEEQVQAADAMATENQISTAHLKEKEDEVHALSTETQKLTRLMETMQRKLQMVEDQKADTESERETLRNQIMAMERELEVAKKQASTDTKAVEQFKRERDNLSKNMRMAQRVTEKQIHLVKVHTQSREILEQEIGGYKEEAQKQRKIIYQLEQERDRYINKASDLTQKVLQHMEELKVRELHIFDLKKEMAELDTKLKQQHNLYEAVRLDRNLYSKNLIECQDEITELKRKLGLMTHQVAQLREEIQKKEATLLKEQLGHQRVEKEKTSLKEEIQRMKHQMAENQAYLESSKAEQHKLLHVISDADALRLRQKKDLDQVLSERDILGTQLVRRNDELSLLYEKVKLQDNMLRRGEQQYNQRIQDLRLLKMEIRNLRRQSNILKNRTACLQQLQTEVRHTENHLLKEQARCRALEEEMENPLNVHRWRTLQGVDPPTYELLQKTHHLQKRLIVKTEEVVEKEQVIRDKERLYLQLRLLLAQQPGPEAAEQLSLYKATLREKTKHIKPGPEAAEQLNLYKATLREKTKHIKALASELNMHESQVQEYQYRLETVALELHEVKKKYFHLKKQEQKARSPPLPSVVLVVGPVVRLAGFGAVPQQGFSVLADVTGQHTNSAVV